MKNLRQVLSPTIAFLVAIAPSLSFSARTVTADQIKNSAQTQTYTVPTASTTLIGTTETATVTNKTIDAASNTIVGLGANRYNLMTNGDFENRTSYDTNWTASAGTFAAAATTNILVGAQAATWDSSASSQTLVYSAITVPYGYQGMNCEVSGIFKVPSGTATHTLSAYDGTNTLVSGTIVNSTTAARTTFYFPCPTSGTIQWKLTSVASNEPLIAIDEAYLGIARGIASSNYSTSAPTVTKYTSGSGTYTVPAGVTRLRIRMVGGGAGGFGSGTVTGTAPTAGGDTTFGSNLTAAKGAVGSFGSSGGTGGACTITAPAIGSGFTGGGGQGSAWINPGSGNGATMGGMGGGTMFGSGGAGGTYGGAGQAGPTNSGAGGGGGGGNSGANGVYAGSGGGAGCSIDAWITNSMSIWASSFSYAVGAAGNAGAAGTSGYAGGAGTAGIIEITEYYDGAGTVMVPQGQTGPTVQKFTSGSGTYTKPAGVTYIRVKMIGGGGGGGSSGTGSFGAATDGGDTTFGSILTAGKGIKATTASGGVQVGGAGGAATITAPAIGSGWTGNGGAGATYGGSGPPYLVGGQGGAGIGGQAVTSNNATTAANAASNSGAGGAGAGCGSVGACSAGAGGGAGAYIEAVIVAPSASYSYAVGAAGSGGSAGTSGAAGGNGGSGYIEVTEYYGLTSAMLANSVIARDAVGNKVTTINTVVSKTTTYTATDNEETILLDASGGAWTLSLPAAATMTGKKYILKITTSSANAVTIDPNASETICGSATVKMIGSNDEMQIQSDGTNWQGLGGSCYRSEIAKLNCDSSSAITSQIGNWVSTIGNIATDTCTVTLVTGIFSATPHCLATWAGTSTALMIAASPSSATSVAFAAKLHDNSNPTTVDGFLQCTGPR